MPFYKLGVEEKPTFQSMCVGDYKWDKKLNNLICNFTWVKYSVLLPSLCKVFIPNLALFSTLAQPLSLEWLDSYGNHLIFIQSS